MTVDSLGQRHLLVGHVYRNHPFYRNSQKVQHPLESFDKWVFVSDLKFASHYQIDDSIFQQDKTVFFTTKTMGFGEARERLNPQKSRQGRSSLRVETFGHVRTFLKKHPQNVCPFLSEILSENPNSRTKCLDTLSKNSKNERPLSQAP